MSTRLLPAASIVLATAMFAFALVAARSARAGDAGQSWGNVWVSVHFEPAKPRAGAPVRIDVWTVTGTPTESVSVGAIAPELVREAAFSHIVPLAAPDSLRPDPAHPGRYTVEFVPPHSGLYRITLRAAGAGTTQPARFEFPVWPRGRNPYVAIPLLALAGLITLCVGWIRAQQRAARAG